MTTTDTKRRRGGRILPTLLAPIMALAAACTASDGTEITAAELASIHEDEIGPIVEPDTLLDVANDLCGFEPLTLAFFVTGNGDTAEQPDRLAFVELAEEHVCPGDDEIRQFLDDLG